MKELIDGILDTSSHYYISSTQKAQELLYYLVSVGKFDCTPSYLVDRQNFNSFLLLVMTSGELHFQTRTASGDVRPGQILLLDCHRPHMYFSYDGCSFLFLHFDGAQSAQIYHAIHERNGCVLTPSDINAYVTSIEAFIEDLDRGHKLHEPAVSGEIYKLLLGLYAAPDANSVRVSDSRYVNLAIEHILGHLDKPLDVNSVAAQSGYSASYFSRIFRRATGMSPHQFILKSRIDQAMFLLHTTSSTMQDIAFKTGFNSAASFSYSFRQTTGMSPTEYRKSPLAR